MKLEENLFIINNILLWNIIEKKKHLATWRLEPASLVSDNRYAMLYSRPSCIPKKGCIKPRVVLITYH